VHFNFNNGHLSEHNDYTQWDVNETQDEWLIRIGFDRIPIVDITSLGLESILEVFESMVDVTKFLAVVYLNNIAYFVWIDGVINLFEFLRYYE